MKHYDAVIIGGGSAGLAAAVTLKKNGLNDIIVLEKDGEPGGILQQCIHNGFGLQTFNEQLSGPAYAERFIRQAEELNVRVLCNTMVTHMHSDRTIEYVNPEEGYQTVTADIIILAVGCYERSRGAVEIPGDRPAGVYTAGQAQRYLNIDGYMVGRKVFILGSGDIGLIMARRMTLEGAKVKVVAELMPYSGGLKRNIVQCLDDFGIPLKLSHTVVDIEGKEHVTAVTIAQVNSSGKPIPGTEERYTCDTLLLSCGLIPENELSLKAGVSMNRITNGPLVNESLETSIPGIFACGNVLHVHDLVDYVSEEATKAGANAAKFVLEGEKRSDPEDIIQIRAVDGARYTVPSTIDPDRMDDLLTVRFRVANVFKNSFVSVYLNDERIMHMRKRIMSPGEMEQVILQKKKLQEKEDLKTITIRIEAE